MSASRGKVILVGAGPGDLGLLTLRGREALERADVVIYDALANPRLLEHAKPGAELIYVGKVADQHALPQDAINALLVEKARTGAIVARLKGGDPYIFGRGGEEGEYVAARGVAFEEIPGVTSAVAAPAYAGIPLTHRDFVSSVMFVTGHERPDKTRSAHNWKAYVDSGATLVFLMGVKNLANIASELMAAGMPGTMPAAIIYRGTTPEQRSLRAPLASLYEEAAAQGFSNPSVVVVGKVAGMRGSLDWFERKPLLGRSIVVTRARDQASDIAKALTVLGANVLECPSIEIKPMPDYAACDAAIGALASYDWLVFTSVNGVKYFWKRLAKAGLDSRALAGAKVAVIGPATANALAARGINADLTPDSYVAESVAKAIKTVSGEDLSGKRFLLPRAAKAREALPDELAASGAIVDIVPMYETIPGTKNVAQVREFLEEGKLDCVTFGSSSTVENFLKLLPAEELKKHPEVALAAIGPVTAATLEKHGLKAAIQPETFTMPGLVEGVAAYFSDHS